MESFTGENFRIIYHTLKNCRQIQSYGIFYQMKGVDRTEDYTEQDYQVLEQYITSSEQPISQRERVSWLTGDTQYTLLRAKLQPRKV